MNDPTELIVPRPARHMTVARLQLKGVSYDLREL